MAIAEDGREDELAQALAANALEHQLEFDQLRGLLIAAHCRGRHVPALRDERPAGPSSTPFKQTVLAHHLPPYAP